MRGSPGPGGGYCPVLGELLANQANYPDNAVITTTPSQESVTEPIQISAKLRLETLSVRMAAVARWPHGPLPSKWRLCSGWCSPFPRCLRLIVHTL